jgi:pimeloyl-ACP methyl ester carboxylesterase
LEGQGYYFQGGGIANFDYQKIVEKYHLVVVSMPKTPVVVSKENLNERFLYVPDLNNPNELSKEYVEADYLDNYVIRANAVIQFLNTKSWVNPDKLVVAGASQGSKVATKIAAANNQVSHLGLFSANPFGRIDQYIRQSRLDAQLGKISWEKADSLMNRQYDIFTKAYNSDSIKKQPRLMAWRTFSEPFYDDWLSFDIPIYLAYGTEDRTSDLCDLIPLFFIQNNKTNLTLKRYLHLEHNFFELDENGELNFEKGHWNDVMMEFINWLDVAND